VSAVARVRPDALRCFVDEDVTRSTREVLVDEHRVPCGVGLSQFVPVEVLGRPLLPNGTDSTSEPLFGSKKIRSTARKCSIIPERSGAFGRACR
jgi:hypothetical protein